MSGCMQGVYRDAYGTPCRGVHGVVYRVHGSMHRLYTGPVLGCTLRETVCQVVHGTLVGESPGPPACVGRCVRVHGLHCRGVYGARRRAEHWAMPSKWAQSGMLACLHIISDCETSLI